NLAVVGDPCRPRGVPPDARRGGLVGDGPGEGTVAGLAFDQVGSPWLTGQPDDPSTTVVWLIGQEPGGYPVPADGRSSAGDYTVSSTTGTPVETNATDGQVTLDALASEPRPQAASICRSRPGSSRER